MINRIFVALVLAVSTALLALAHTVDGQARPGGRPVPRRDRRDRPDRPLRPQRQRGRLVAQPVSRDAARHRRHVRRGRTARRVLLLTGDGSHLQLPADALSGEDTISVTAWLFLPTGASGPVFDFGQNAANRMFAEASKTGFRASIVVGGTVRGETAAKPVLENQWVHVAVVLDPASRVLTDLSRRRARSAQATDVTVNATQIVSQAEGAANRLFIGKSQDDAEPTLHGAAARRPHLSHRADATSRWPRSAPTCGRQTTGTARRAAAGDLDGQHPEGVAVGVAAVARARHHGRTRSSACCRGCRRRSRPSIADERSRDRTCA